VVYTVHFAAAVAACHLTAYALLRSRWPVHSPRVAIVCWQALGLGVGLSAIGVPLSLGLAPYQESTGRALRLLVRDPSPLIHRPGGPGHLALIGLAAAIAVVLVGSTVSSLRTAAVARSRQRDLLALVAHPDPKAPGALVLDHPRAAAYCVPGLRPRVVVSAGTLDLLDRGELAAVLAHEHAHARERHDLVLLPFTALCRALPGVRWIRTAFETVALLVEMRADDRARLLHSEASLAGALTRFATGPAPAGTLGAAEHDLDARVRRLGEPTRRTPAVAAGALVVATVLAALPVSLYLA